MSQPNPPSPTDKKIHLPLLSHIIKLLTGNLAAKLLSLLLAIILWSVILTTTNPVRTRTIEDVQVQVIGQSQLLERNLWIKQDLTALLKTVDVDISVAQNDRKRLTSGQTRALIDLSTIFQTGKQEIKVLMTPPVGTFIQANPSSITIDVEKRVVSTIPVRVRQSGKLPDGYRLIDQPTVSFSSIQITGVASDVSQIKFAEVELDLSDITKPFDYSLPYTLLGSDNQPIATQTLEISEGISVIVSGHVYPRQTKPVKENGVTGKTAPGFVCLSIEIQPQDGIQIAAPQEVLDTIDSLTIDPINIQGLSESFQFLAPIKLPGDISWAETEQVSVMVVISEEEETKVFYDIDLQAKNQRASTNVQYDDKQRFTIQIKGARSIVRQIRSEDIVAYIDLSTYTVGTHDVPIEIEIPGVYNVTCTPAPGTIKVVISPLGGK